MLFVCGIDKLLVMLEGKKLQIWKKFKGRKKKKDNKIKQINCGI